MICSFQSINFEKKLYKKVLTLLIKNVNIILVLERRANI